MEPKTRIEYIVYWSWAAKKPNHLNEYTSKARCSKLTEAIKRYNGLGKQYPRFHKCIVKHTVIIEPIDDKILDLTKI